MPLLVTMPTLEAWSRRLCLRPLAILLLAAAPAGVVLPDAASAKGERTVTACSRYGNGCYTAPVRPGRFGGLEMRLKSGTWIDCEGSCKDTLREKTVDFWDTMRERSSGRD